MDSILFLTCLVIVFLGTIGMCVNLNNLSTVDVNDSKANKYALLILLYIFVIVASMISCYAIYKNPTTPQAIDVYRGHTELQITSVNDMPQDTIVVWKNK